MHVLCHTTWKFFLVKRLHLFPHTLDLRSDAWLAWLPTVPDLSMSLQRASHALSHHLRTIGLALWSQMRMDDEWRKGDPTELTYLCEPRHCSSSLCQERESVSRRHLITFHNEPIMYGPYCAAEKSEAQGPLPKGKWSGRQSQTLKPHVPDSKALCFCFWEKKLFIKEDLSGEVFDGFCFFICISLWFPGFCIKHALLS